MEWQKIVNRVLKRGLHWIYRIGDVMALFYKALNCFYLIIDNNHFLRIVKQL